MMKRRLLFLLSLVLVVAARSYAQTAVMLDSTVIAGYLHEDAIAESLSRLNHLEFLGISMNCRSDIFTSLLRRRGFRRGLSSDTPDGVSEEGGKKYMHGRYENFDCNLEIGHNGNGRVDTVRVMLLQINNPVNSFKVFHSFYIQRYGEPYYDNFYEAASFDDSTADQLAEDPYLTVFTLPGGTVEMHLSYNADERRYDFSFAYIDSGNALPVIPTDSDDIIW